MKSPLRIEMLGGLQVRVDDRRIARFRTRQTGALLAYLACHPQNEHSREVLIDILWPDADTETGRNNLNLALTSLRRQLEPPGTSAGSVLRTTRLTVQLDPEAFETDVSEFEAALRSAKRTTEPEEKRAHLQSALDLYRGDLLPGYYEDWVLDESHRLQALHELAAEQLASLPLPEIEPARERQRTSPRRKREEPARARGPAPRLPMQFTRFFGRELEIAELAGMLSQPETRLLTLAGPGGSGKTRLAIETARRAAGDFPGGVCFAPLADLSDPRLIPGAIVDALGLPRSPATEPMDQVESYLNRDPQSPLPCLLVLDNFEHLLAAEIRKSEDGATVVRALQERCPNLSLLVTSRRTLGLEGERVYPVPPLPVPEPDASDEPACLVKVASVALFSDRAQEVRPDFAVTSANAEAVARLCARLEGIPLAVELCAARVGALSPRQMLVQLERPFELLVSRKRVAEGRHQTLWAALEWSYRLLPPELRRFFCRLSVFRGGWTAEAAAAVCLEEPLSANPTTCLWMLEQLQDASLVRADELDGEMRWRMLETLREFGTQKLSPGEREAMSLRHAGEFLRFAEEAEPRIVGPEQAEWLVRMDQEHDNLIEALTWAFENGDETGPRLAGALTEYWERRHLASEARTWLGKALAMEERLPAMLRMKCLDGAVRSAIFQGDYKDAEEQIERCLSLRRALPGMEGLGYTLTLRGSLMKFIGKNAEALASIEEALGTEDGQGSPRVRAIALRERGYLHAVEGELDPAKALFLEALENWRRCGDQAGYATVLASIGWHDRNRGDHASARRREEEALEINRRLNNEHGVAYNLNMLGTIATHQGEFAVAEGLLEEALKAFQKIGDRDRLGHLHVDLCHLRIRQGRYAEAKEHAETALSIFRSVEDPVQEAWTLQNLANLSFMEGDRESASDKYRLALRLFGDNQRENRRRCLRALAGLAAVRNAAARAARLLAAAGAPVDINDCRVCPPLTLETGDLLDSLRASLGEDLFESEWTAGKAMSLEEAVAYALEEDEP